MNPTLPAPLVRELRRSPLLGAIAAATAPIWYELVRLHDDVRTSAMLALVAGGALLGFAFDDPAQRTLNACALGRTTRRWARLLVVAALLTGCWVIVVIAVEVRGAELGPVSDRLPEAIAAASLASAFAAVGLRSGMTTPGFGAALIAVLGMTVSTGMSMWSSRLEWLPRVADPGHATRWWVTGAIAAVAAVWWARDPAARRFATTSTTRRTARRRSSDTSVEPGHPTGHEGFASPDAGGRSSIVGKPADGRPPVTAPVTVRQPTDPSVRPPREDVT